jgi:hypothetical protein
MAQRRWHAGCRDEIDVHKELHEARPDTLDRYELDDDLNTLTHGVEYEREQYREN